MGLRRRRLCWAVLYARMSRQANPVGRADPGVPRSGLCVLHDRRPEVRRQEAPEAISASAQSLIFIATNGIGLFLGTQLAGFVMEKNSVGGKFQWSKIWAVPLGITVSNTMV